jgi:hypothetical protein
MVNIQNKKGMSIGDMYPTVLTIVLVGIVLGVGLYVLGTFHDQISPDLSGSQNLINCSTPTTLTDAALTNFNLSKVDTAVDINGSAVTNYTFTGAGVITWGADLDLSCTTKSDLINITYTYQYDAANSAQKAVTTTATGLATFADWIAIIVVVIAAAIVLGVVLTSFGRKRNSI